MGDSRRAIVRVYGRVLCKKIVNPLSLLTRQFSCLIGETYQPPSTRRARLHQGRQARQGLDAGGRVFSNLAVAAGRARGSLRAVFGNLGDQLEDLGARAVAGSAGRKARFGACSVGLAPMVETGGRES